jgi:hypothetical protein
VPITVVSVIPLGGTERVYNMTIEEDHVYHVGMLNLLSHNMDCRIFKETFNNPADAIGDVHGVANLVGQGKTKHKDIVKGGFTQTHYYRDSNGIKHTVFYNPQTGEYGGDHYSTGQDYD